MVSSNLQGIFYLAFELFFGVHSKIFRFIAATFARLIENLSISHSRYLYSSFNLNNTNLMHTLRQY